MTAIFKVRYGELPTRMMCVIVQIMAIAHILVLKVYNVMLLWVV